LGGHTRQARGNRQGTLLNGRAAQVTHTWALPKGQNRLVSRLEHDDANLAERLVSLPEADRRAVALRAARSAVEATGLADSRINVAVEALAAGQLGNAAAARGVEAVVTELDEKAWALTDDPDASDEYDVFFRQARAAAAVGFLFDPDASTAACEAIYEAGAATDEYPVIDSIG
jgi:hypothetical protein